MKPNAWWKSCAVSLAAWGGAAAWMHHRGLNFVSSDDFYRLVMAMGWAARPFFCMPGSIWPPLPTWIFGSVYWLLRAWMPVYWYLPCAALLLAAGTILTQDATATLGEMANAGAPARRPSAPWMVPLLALTIPFVWRLAASGLAESVAVVCQSLFLVCLVRHLRRPAPGTRALALAGLIAAQMTRYEAWPLGLAVWPILILGAWPGLRLKQRLPWLLGGWAALGVFPAAWLFLQWVHSDLSSYFTLVLRGGNPELLRWMPPRQPFTALFRSQGWAIIPCLVVGLWLRRRERAVGVLALLTAVTGGLYAMAVANSRFQILAPERLPLLVLWTALPLAALGLGALWDWGLRHKGVACVLILIVAGWKIQALDRAEWGGPVVPWPDLHFIEEAGRKVRREGYVLVLDNPAQNAYLLNLLRCNAGLDLVVGREWLTAERTARGRFLLFTPEADAAALRQADAAGLRRAGAALGYQVFRGKTD